MTRLELLQKLAHELRKTSASFRMAKHLKARLGRRPIRVDTLLKKTSSQAGQDLRLPVMGGTKLPTSDSKEYSKSLLNKSQRGTEVGPSPTLNSLKPPGPKIKDIVSGVKGTKNLMPKFGEAMSADPLVQYLAKQAMTVEDNEDSAPKGKEVKPVHDESPEASKDAVRSSKSQQSNALSEYFDTSKGIRKKYNDKDHPAEVGVVDRILQKS